MRFYSIGLFSVVLLAVIYFVGTWVLVAFGAWLRRRWKRAWWAMVPLFLLLYIAPIAEELWIAWNFGRLCRQDAGLFIYKTVEVEGFYDDTHSWRADKLRESGFRWVEGRDRTVFDKLLWRHEWVGNEIRSFKIDRPTARYHYQWPHMNAPSGYKVEKTERRVVDIQTQEVLGRYVDYGRRAPWFYVGLDAPLMFCEEGETDARELGSTFGPRMVLRPVRQSLQSEEIRR
jgi:hypothetical protein